jgi:hypothetical protein
MGVRGKRRGKEEAAERCRGGKAAGRRNIYALQPCERDSIAHTRAHEAQKARRSKGGRELDSARRAKCRRGTCGSGSGR